MGLNNTTDKCCKNNNATIRVVIYSRVSRKDENIENQIEKLKDWAKQNGWEVVYISDKDKNVSAYEIEAFKRKGFLEAYEKAKEYKANLLVISLDRISRRYKDLVKTLNKLREEGIQVISYQEPFLRNLTNIQDNTLRSFIYDLIVMALGFGYELYSKSVSEKTKIALEVRRKKGVKVGRPYKLNNEQIELLRKLYENGEAISRIARILGVDRSTVYRYLKRLGLKD